MANDFLSGVFSLRPPSLADSASGASAGAIDKGFRPAKGIFFRTLDFPTTDADNKFDGRMWFEAGYDATKASWTLWQKNVRKLDDILTGGSSNVLSQSILLRETDFVTAYDQMTSFEESQKAQNIQPLPGKTPAKLNGDYYRQFAWREGLMMSRSGRLYPMTDKLSAENLFDQSDLDGAAEFLKRLKTEQFIAVPVTLPAGDWEAVYKAHKTQTDQRLNKLTFDHGGDKNNYDLALQIVGQEDPAILYLHMQRGFTPKIFEEDRAKHFALLEAAIGRADVNPLALLTQAGFSFYSQRDDVTPIELALRQKRYSHLQVMLSREGETLANYADAQGNSPAATAIALQDRQAFRMLYVEGLDYGHTDKNGMKLVHHAFTHSFLPAVYAWLDEGLSIDEPVQGTSYTGLSIARSKKDQPLVDFALAKDANKDAPDFPALEAVPAKSAPTALAASAPVIEFSVELLNSGASNSDVIAAATSHGTNGGSLDILGGNGLSLLETCWKNQKPSADLNRRLLIPVFGQMGADPAALLADGTTVLTRTTSGTALDMDFLKMVAPLAHDVNSPDANGNNLLHTLQMNPSEIVGHSNNVAAILKLFPALDLHRPNNDGFSNIGLAVRLNRAMTLKAMPQPAALKADWNQTTASGWSMLDLAFTAAFGMERVTGAPRADKITVVNDATRNALLDMLDRASKIGAAESKQSLAAAFIRARPDGKTLAQALRDESAPAPLMARLKSSGMPEP
jgi:hypothetical protein